MLACYMICSRVFLVSSLDKQNTIIIINNKQKWAEAEKWGEDEKEKREKMHSLDDCDWWKNYKLYLYYII